MPMHTVFIGHEQHVHVPDEAGTGAVAGAEKPAPKEDYSIIVGCSVANYIASVVFLYLGFNALINGQRHVGGDAYNLIIDAARATAHLTMAGATAIIATMFIVIFYLRKMHKNADAVKH